MNALKLKVFNAIDFFLQIQEGPEKGRLYKISPPKILIGRDQSCQIALQDPKVSRQQCMILFGEDVICRDLSSRKTTLVNGKPCQDSKLRPGDFISFGDTQIKFLGQAKPEAKPALPGQNSLAGRQSPEKAQAQKRIQMFLVGILVLAGVLSLLQEEPMTSSPQTLLTQEDIRKQIEESRERQDKLIDPNGKKDKSKSDRYLYDVEQHFISGFRDFQNAQYGRALDAFGTTIATDYGHLQAHQYARSAKKKRDDLVDTHMRDGVRYREKMMYNRCSAEFEKAVVLMNDTNSERFKLAKTQLEECRMLQSQGGR